MKIHFPVEGADIFTIESGRGEGRFGFITGSVAEF